MSYELDKLRLNPKERERLLFVALKRVRYNGGIFNKIHQYRRNKFKEMTHKTYGTGTLGYLLWHLRDNGYIKSEGQGKPYQITPKGKLALKRGFVELEPEKPYEKYMAWCGVVAIPVGLFSPEIRVAAKWIWQVLSDFLCRIF